MILAKNKENYFIDIEYMRELILQHPDYSCSGYCNYNDLVHVAFVDLQDKLLAWEKENNSKNT